MNQRRISIAAPVFCGNEKKYVNDCLDTTWVSSIGKYVDEFEYKFAEFCQVKHAISCSNGTVALHLAMLAYDIKPGDEVIVPTFTYVATANCVKYCGATPIFVDSDPETWNINPKLIEKVISPKTKGIIVVHIYGHPVDMDPIIKIAKKHHLFLVEDAAEAHGAEYKGKKVGSVGDIGTFSFFGNKIITTGEGGMVTTNDNNLARLIRQMKGQGVDPNQRYWFPMVGYNYRMTNIEAAIGLAQLEKIEWHTKQRQRIANHYKQRLSVDPRLIIQPQMSYAKNSYWMISVLLSNDMPERSIVMNRMDQKGIETRPFFYPMHVLPMYKENQLQSSFPVANSIYLRGLNLPSSGSLSNEELDYICDSLLECVK
ncbi:MAG: DegT/DnrJ/EryC1/StrS family aminotransferase [Pelolinea sp.]|jgi:perosamine synthetase|nr:DegT/DnrJ/EryC1/StrS family aminotransferase [Pelolinea sp.]